MTTGVPFLQIGNYFELAQDERIARFGAFGSGLNHIGQYQTAGSRRRLVFARKDYQSFARAYFVAVDVLNDKVHAEAPRRQRYKPLIQSAPVKQVGQFLGLRRGRQRVVELINCAAGDRLELRVQVRLRLVNSSLTVVNQVLVLDLD